MGVPVKLVLALLLDWFLVAAVVGLALGWMIQAGKDTPEPLSYDLSDLELQLAAPAESEEELEPVHAHSLLG